MTPAETVEVLAEAAPRVVPEVMEREAGCRGWGLLGGGAFVMK